MHLIRWALSFSLALSAVLAQPEPSERLHQHKVTQPRSPAPEPGAENEIIPSLVDGLRSPDDWYRKRRPEILANWMHMFGKLEPNEADKRWFGDIAAAKPRDARELEGYTRYQLDLPMETDFNQPHLLLVPKGKGPFPAVICWTSSGPDYAAPEEYWGKWLAQHGYVVLTGWSFIRHYRDDTVLAAAAEKVYQRFGHWLPMAKMVHDARREAEYLRSLPQVDGSRIGFIGFSLGAKAAVYVAAFAPEIKATVALDPHIAVNGGTNWYAPWYLDWLRPFPDIPTGQHTVLSLLNPNPQRPGFEHDHHELMALTAPRPFLLIGGSQSEDSGGDSDDLESWGYYNRAREVYALLGIPERIQFVSTADGHKPNGPHIDPAWQAFFERWLKPNHGEHGVTTEGHGVSAQMVEGINQYLERAAAESVAKRARHWKRDYSSADAYNESVARNREHLRRIIGAVDPRLPVSALQLDATTAAPAEAGSGAGYKVLAVRWPVFEGVDAEGLLLEPAGKPVARVVAIPDADWSPEMLAGAAPGVEPQAQFARRLAENGCQVLIPVLIDRADTWSGFNLRMTNLPHREWIYRMAFETGRQIIGYEVQKVLAAVDWFTHENTAKPAPIAVMGYGEGGLLALYSAALDPRIQAAVVSGYFQPRQELWKEPIYRDVWALLDEFGDAELASLVAPRPLIVEAGRGPQVEGPPARTNDRSGATPNGKLATPPLAAVREEVERARSFFAPLGAAEKLQLVVSRGGEGPPGSDETLGRLLRSAGVTESLKPPGPPPAAIARDPSVRLHRQFDQLVSYTQKLIARSASRRAEFWSKADASSVERWKESTKPYRDYVWSEVIGRLPSPDVPANPRTRLLYDEPKFRGYEVTLDVWPGVFAYGILLVPRDIGPGERRPVVVCQHGLEGRPQDVADPKVDSPYYHRFAVQLAEKGFVTFAPQNPYIGEDRFRIIQRRAHPLKLGLFSFILGQHQRILEYLAAQPFVDASRIGFYGLSYGGKTAMRVPPLLDGYALSICSADFNEWVWKTTNIEAPHSYMLTGEYDMYEFDFANVVNYAELATLMAPRPFMVERGHRDGVGLDEFVAFEFAKVQRFYAGLGLADRTEIEFFDGPHTINGKGTFEFLKRNLNWPDRGR